MTFCWRFKYDRRDIGRCRVLSLDNRLFVPIIPNCAIANVSGYFGMGTMVSRSTPLMSPQVVTSSKARSQRPSIVCLQPARRCVPSLRRIHSNLRARNGAGQLLYRASVDTASGRSLFLHGVATGTRQILLRTETAMPPSATRRPASGTLKYSSVIQRSIGRILPRLPARSMFLRWAGHEGQVSVPDTPLVRPTRRLAQRAASSEFDQLCRTRVCNRERCRSVPR